MPPLVNYHHGVRVTEDSDGRQALTLVSTATIGLIATGPAADAKVFPPVSGCISLR